MHDSFTVYILMFDNDLHCQEDINDSVEKLKLHSFATISSLPIPSFHSRTQFCEKVPSSDANLES